MWYDSWQRAVRKGRTEEADAMVVHGACLGGVLDAGGVPPPRVLADVLVRALLPVVRLPHGALRHLRVATEDLAGLNQQAAWQWPFKGVGQQACQAVRTECMHAGLAHWGAEQMPEIDTDARKNIYQTCLVPQGGNWHLQAEHAEVIGLELRRPKVLVAQQRTGCLHEMPIGSRWNDQHSLLWTTQSFRVVMLVVSVTARHDHCDGGKSTAAVCM